MISTCGITIVMFQDEHSGVVYKASADFTQLSNGDMGIVANFSNLTENMLYRPSISVYNNGIKLQESNHVDTTQVNASKCVIIPEVAVAFQSLGGKNPACRRNFAN